MESEYLKVLLRENPTVAERYRLKLKMINNEDPFTLNNQDLDYSTDLLPPVTYLDIVAYLTLTHSFYTKQQMKAYKSLQSYKYFEAGFVLKAGTKLINDLCIFVGQVKHSQKASQKAFNVWSIIAKDGSVLTAHCTCMAGNSEVCCRVGVILCMAEFSIRKKKRYHAQMSFQDGICHRCQQKCQLYVFKKLIRENRLLVHIILAREIYHQ